MNFDVNTLFLLAVPSFPLVLAIVLMIKPSSKNLLLLAPLMAFPSLLLVLFMTIDVYIEIPWLLLNSFIGFNETARVFLFFTSILWLFGGIYALGYFAKEEKSSIFFIWFLLAMAGNFGLIIAQDMVLFYTFFTLMSLSSYGLVVHSKSPEAFRAGRVYIVLAIVGEILLFTAFSIMMASSDSVEFSEVREIFVQGKINNLIIILLLLGFGIKAGIIGLHVWLPLAHPVAPTPASAILSGAMVSTGLLGLMQVLPLGKVELPFWGAFMMVLGLISTFYAVLVGLFQDNTKTVLAYSSISSMGLMIMAIGLGLVSPELWVFISVVILVYILQHGFSKAALFLAVGIFTKHIESKIMRTISLFALFIPILSLIGAPLTSGFTAKNMLGIQMSLSASPWAEWIQVLVPWSSLSISLLLARFLYLLLLKTSICSGNLNVQTDHLPKSMWISWLFLVFMVVFSPIFIGFLGIETISMLEYTSLQALIDFTMMLGIVILLFYLAWYTTRRYPIAEYLTIPAGDMLIFVEKYILPKITKSLIVAVHLLEKSSQWLINHTNRTIAVSTNMLISCMGEIDKRLKQWTVAIVLLLVIMFIFMFILWTNTSI